MRVATIPAGTNFVPRGDFVPNFPANDEFGAIIRAVRTDNKLTRKVIGNIAGVGPDTVKAWERGRQIPRSDNLFRLAQTVPAVRRWTLRKLGVPDMPEFMTPQLMTAAAAAVYQVAQQPGPDGDAVRAAIMGAMKP